MLATSQVCQRTYLSGPSLAHCGQNQLVTSNRGAVMGMYVQTINRPSQTELFTKSTLVYTFQQIKSWLSLQLGILQYANTE